MFEIDSYSSIFVIEHFTLHPKLSLTAPTLRVLSLHAFVSCRVSEGLRQGYIDSEKG